MKVGKDTVVSFHYRLTGADDELLEDSHAAGQPVLVLLGHGQILPGIEAALIGHEAGDSVSVALSAEEGYGAHRDDLIQRVPKKYFPNPKRLKPGQVVSLALRQGGTQQVRVHKIGMSTVDVDINHPLAGKALNFAIEVNEVREASPEELAHGHAHPAGGAHGRDEGSDLPASDAADNDPS